MKEVGWAEETKGTSEELQEARPGVWGVASIHFQTNVSKEL